MSEVDTKAAAQPVSGRGTAGTSGGTATTTGRGGGARVQLRGKTYDEQVAALTPEQPGAAAGLSGPVQLKPAPEAQSCLPEPREQASGDTKGAGQSEYKPWLDADRVTALIAMQTLDETVDKRVGDVIEWQAGAWEQLVIETGGDPFVAMTGGEWYQMFMAPFQSSLAAAAGLEAAPPAVRRGGPQTPRGRDGTGRSRLGGVADAAGNTLLEAGISAGGKAALGGGSGAAAEVLLAALGGTGVPGLILGTLVNLAWAAISDLIFGDEALDAMVRKARVDGAKMFAAMRRQLASERGEIVASWHAHRGGLRECVQTTMDEGDLDRITRWCASSQRSMNWGKLATEPLSAQLLSLWRRQRANTKDEANKYTSEATFEAVDSKTDAPSAQAPQFIDQAKFEWGRRGIELDQPVAVLESAWERVKSLPMDRQVATLAALPPITLEPSRSPEIFERTTPPPSRMPAVPNAYEDLAAAVRLGAVSLTCRLVPTAPGGIVMAKSFAYDLSVKPEFDAELNTTSQRGKPDARAMPRHWEEEVG